MDIYYLGFVYFLIASFMEVFCVKVNRNLKLMMLGIVFISLIFLSTIYYGPNGDVYAYERYFNSVKFSHLIHPVEPFEKGYILLNAILRVFTNKYWVLRLAQAIIVIGLWWRIFLSKDGFLYGKEFLALFCLWSLKQGNIFIARSSIAVCILIYSLKYIEEKRLNRFLTMFVIAMLFHTLAIVFLPAYWLYHWKGKRKFFYIAMIAAEILSPFLPNIITAIAGLIPHTYLRVKIIHYINDIGLISYTSISYTQQLLKSLINMGSSVIIFEFISKNTRRENSKLEGRMNLYALGVLIYMIAINVSTGMTRAALPYMDMQMILLPQIFDCPFANKNIGNRMIVFMVFVLYLFLRMYVNVIELDYITMFS